MLCVADTHCLWTATEGCDSMRIPQNTLQPRLAPQSRAGPTKRVRQARRFLLWLIKVALLGAFMRHQASSITTTTPCAAVLSIVCVKRLARTTKCFTNNMVTLSSGDMVNCSRRYILHLKEWVQDSASSCLLCFTLFSSILCCIVYVTKAP